MMSQFYIESKSIRRDGTLTEYQQTCDPSGKTLMFDTWREAADYAEKGGYSLERWMSREIRIRHKDAGL